MSPSFASQLRTAQLAYDNMSAYDEDAEARSTWVLERTEELLDDSDWLAANVPLADAIPPHPTLSEPPPPPMDEHLDGSYSGEHYSEVERVLADLHDVQPAIAKATGAAPAPGGE